MVIPAPISSSPEGACSQPIFEEKFTAADVKVHNGLAQVWAHYAARFGPQSAIEEWNGIDAFTLLGSFRWFFDPIRAAQASNYGTAAVQIGRCRNARSRSNLNS
jgi:hypothetical protein